MPQNAFMAAPETGNGSSGSALDRETILIALENLADALRQRNVTGELCLFGGSVMVLAFNARPSTKDVDAIFEPAQVIRELAREIADRQGLPENWLNDAVKGFVPGQPEVTAGNLPQFPNLRLTMPVPEYLLAMKCMAARIGGTTGEASDVSDIVFLVRRLGMATADEVLDLVARYYPEGRISVKTQYLVEGLFEEGKI
ncbi:MAG: hypothetical protein EHM61_05840 [Acidobacteria bacterium]|nr:MAG: hypothetical protein EHM61_05840 [Acidobacteriota bacterium]